ncbi:B-Box C-terminal domain [Pristimantis euphronides]
MASAELRYELLCSICLSTYTDPVMLRCGHNFCRLCIGRVLDTQDESGVYSCSVCREEFQERPALMRCLALHNIMENLLSIQPTQTETGIFCTYCVDSPVPAVKSCLHCEASLCDKHLRVHSKSAEHVLSAPSTSLENRKCSVHKKVLDYYCTEDAACICVSCSLAGEHRGHQVEILKEASEKKKEKLRNVLQILTTKRKKTEERVQSLADCRRKAPEKASGEAERVTALCTDIRRRVDDLEKKVLSEISRQEKEESLSLSAFIQKLEIKKEELSRKMRHIEELCNRTDPLTVLQEPDTGDLCDPEEEGGDEDTGGHGGGDKDTEGHDGGDFAVISDTLHTLCDIMTGIRRGIYVNAPADIKLDVNTASNNLHISDDLKTATATQEKQNGSETAERFRYNQVMSRRRFSSGQHYWDVETNRSGLWRVGMCYPSIDRRRLRSLIGDNKKSWSLRRYNNQFSVRHDRKEIRLPDKISSNRIRVCLDYEAGRLSFYELCDPIRHLHTFKATFTRPLHAALCVWLGPIKILGENHNSKKVCGGGKDILPMPSSAVHAVSSCSWSMSMALFFRSESGNPTQGTAHVTDDDLNLALVTLRPGCNLYIPQMSPLSGCSGLWSSCSVSLEVFTAYEETSCCSPAVCLRSLSTGPESASRHHGHLVYSMSSIVASMPHHTAVTSTYRSMVEPRLPLRGASHPCVVGSEAVASPAFMVVTPLNPTHPDAKTGSALKG